MKIRHCTPLTLFSLLAAAGIAAPDTIERDAIRIDAPEMAHLDFSRSTGGLTTAAGVETYTVIRADREHPERSDGYGWTYHHHPDLAAWQGRLYVAWNSCERDEDTWPSHELYSWSENGRDWSKPAELFPQGVSTACRMYFFRAPTGRMLVLSGMRAGQPKFIPSLKGSLVVRELHADHTWGPVYSLRQTDPAFPGQPPLFTTSTDEAFVTSCRQLLADHVFLLQADYGMMLDPSDRMVWNNPANWGEEAKQNPEVAWFGKAMCFYERADGALVGVGKSRWVTLSRDGGKTWSRPVQPPTFITGWGKVWVERIPDGRWIMVYNPHPGYRWPLAMVESDDGISFRRPVALHGPLEPRRYDGEHKDLGLSYHRGLNHWNSDGSWKRDAVWLVASLNKEELRVLRIPFPAPAPSKP